MRSINEIRKMLLAELYRTKENLKQGKGDFKYLNEMMGDTSFLLAGLLNSHLKNEFEEWNCERWIDDSLIEDVEINGGLLRISGIVVWGIEDRKEQWVEPFLFEIELKLKVTGFSQYTLFSGDLNLGEISYDDFKNDRKYWSRSKRDWKYIIFFDNKS